jgi:glutamate synthase domain-containing protein 3
MEKLEKPVLNYLTPLEEVVEAVAGQKEIEIDCGVLDLSGKRLNEMMKIARAQGVEHFILKNVCGQNLVGTGIEPPARISVYGILGNHSCAFVDRLLINSYPTRFKNDVWCPGDAQVGIGTSANPTELNIAGSVDDLFASFAPSGRFRVAGQGGNRCVLRAGAGIPAVWREIDYEKIEDMTDSDRIEEMLYLYQKRRAAIHLKGWDNYIDGFKYELERRSPPVVLFGRRVKDYFMEYAQGTVGVVLNLYDFDSPIGYYVCSGMTAGRAFIRGKVDDSQLGVNVKKGKLEKEDRELLIAEMKGFHDCFSGVLQSERYERNLDRLMMHCEKDPEKFTSEFVKIVPV